jgi:protein-S-isoprenylcysteine O-methyltransferase Ste14
MKNAKTAMIIRVVIMMLFVLVLIPLLPVLVSGKWGWWQAWLMAAVYVLAFLLSRAIAARKNPGILRERANFNTQGNIQPWDKWLSPLVAFGSVIIPLAAGLDARFQWSSGFSLWAEMPGLALILAGYVLASWAFIVNAYFSGTVRLQEERGHAVVSGGPYGWMRHPGYAGSLLANFGIPLLLGSAWAFIPAVVFSAFLVIRTGLEDKFLQENLPGYKEYARKTRYRLIPGVW